MVGGGSWSERDERKVKKKKKSEQRRNISCQRISSPLRPAGQPPVFRQIDGR